MPRCVICREYYKQIQLFSAPYLNVQHTGANGIVKGIPSDIATESSAWVVQKEIGAVLSRCCFIQATLSWPFKVLQSFAKNCFSFKYSVKLYQH